MMEIGEVTEVENNKDGSYLVWFGERDYAELGVTLYEEDLLHVPKPGDDIALDGYDSGYGLTYLKLNNELQFERSDKEAQLLYAIRKLESNLKELREKLNEFRQDS